MSNYIKKIWNRFGAGLLLVMLAFSLIGCKHKGADQAGVSASGESTVSAGVEATAEITATDSVSEAATGFTESDAASTESSDTATAVESTEPEEAQIPEDGVYTSKEDVALYIHIYGHLPENFITKKEAKKLGWPGGSLEGYADGKCIGGDYFGNYEGVLPEDKTYHECDIDTLGKDSRGAKRIVYSEDGYIYYTEDHYNTFELLYEP